METQRNKNHKRNLEDLQDSSTDEFEGFSSESPNDLINVAGNDKCNWNDIGKTLSGIKASITQVMKMQSESSSFCNGSCRWAVIENILKDIKDSIDYVMEVKNDMEEVKITLNDINSKLITLIEKEENSIVDVHQILTSLPSTSIAGVGKVEQYLNSGTIFSQMKDEFSRIGGHSEKMAVAILNKLISKNVQGQLNWGNNGTSIQSFKNMLMLIHSVCKANSVTYTEKDGNEALKSALKTARSAIN